MGRNGMVPTEFLVVEASSRHEFCLSPAAIGLPGMYVVEGQQPSIRFMVDFGFLRKFTVAYIWGLEPEHVLAHAG